MPRFGQFKRELIPTKWLPTVAARGAMTCPVGGHPLREFSDLDKNF
jgi:hypothetical protein